MNVFNVPVEGIHIGGKAFDLKEVFAKITYPDLLSFTHFDLRHVKTKEATIGGNEMDTQQVPRLHSLLEVQVQLGIKSRKTVLKYIKSGQLLAFKLGGTRWRISSQDLLHFLKSQPRINGALPKEPISW